MKKIISLFKRDYEGTRQVYNEVTEGAEWVIAGEGVATEKIDGTSCLIKDGKLYKRYDCKKGKTPPPQWEPCEPERNAHTGHWPGWVPVGDEPESQYHREAFTAGYVDGDGTYELIGPKIQSNPHKVESHRLVKHGTAKLPDAPRDFESIKQYLISKAMEGIVWHHPDGRMVKIKTKDFGIKWPR